LHLANQVVIDRRWIVSGAEHAGDGGKLSIMDSNLDVRIGAQVLDPVGSVIFRDDVVPSLPLGEPDFDLACLPASTPVRGEIEILFLRDRPSL